MGKIKIAITSKEPNFDKTCELIYSLASNRIKEKYQEWKENKKRLGLSASRVDFTDNQYIQKMISKIMKNDRTDNPYLITPVILPILLNELDFQYEHLIFWGDDVEVYLEDLFVSLLLDMNSYPEYSFHWNFFNLKNESDMRNFYQDYFVAISSNFDKLKDKFLDFTYNSHDYFKTEGNDEVFEITEQKGKRVNEGIIGTISRERQENEQNNIAFLTFFYLPKKVKILAEKILIPLIDDISLGRLIK